jgi:8-oxo-dGTP pyrophosphatase MutT (NUDIX family)
LITSLSKKQWIFPKGIIEDDMSPQQSALMEALEEAGAEGEVVNFILGEYSYPKWGGLCKVIVFPMYVTNLVDNWLESDIRKRKWFPIDEASSLLSKDELRNLLHIFKKNIELIKSKVGVISI